MTEIEREKREQLTMGIMITIMVLLLIIVAVFIYLGATIGSVATKVNNGLDKFKKLTDELGEVSDVLADGIKDVFIPALKEIGPEIKQIVTSSVGLAKGYLTLGSKFIDHELEKVRSQLQSGQIGQGMGSGMGTGEVGQGFVQQRAATSGKGLGAYSSVMSC